MKKSELKHLIREEVYKFLEGCGGKPVKYKKYQDENVEEVENIEEPIEQNPDEEDNIEEVSPPGWSGTVGAMKNIKMI